MCEGRGMLSGQALCGRGIPWRCWAGLGRCVYPRGLTCLLRMCVGSVTSNSAFDTFAALSFQVWGEARMLTGQDRLSEGLIGHFADGSILTGYLTG